MIGNNILGKLLLNVFDMADLEKDIFIDPDHLPEEKLALITSALLKTQFFRKRNRVVFAGSIKSLF